MSLICRDVKSENHCLHWNSLRLRVSLCCKLEIQEYHTGWEWPLVVQHPAGSDRGGCPGLYPDGSHISDTNSREEISQLLWAPASLSDHLQSNLYWVRISQVSRCVFHYKPPRRKSLPDLAWRWAHLQLLISWLLVMLHGVIPLLVQDFAFIELHEAPLSPFF